MGPPAVVVEAVGAAQDQAQVARAVRVVKARSAAAHHREAAVAVVGALAAVKG